MVAAVWIVGWFRAAPVQFRDIGGGLLGNSYFTVNFWLLRLAGVGGYFGARFGDQTAPALVVAQHRGAVLSRLVGPSGGAASAQSAIAARRRPRHRRRVVRLLRRAHPGRSDRRLLPAVVAGVGARARGARRLPRGFPAQPLAVSLARHGEPWRGARGRADPGGLSLLERGGAVSRLARGHSNARLRAGDREPRLRRREGRARQPGRRFLRPDLLSALSVALAAVRLRPHLARRHSDAGRDVRARGRSRRAGGADPPLRRGARDGALSPPPLRARARPRRGACGDRNPRPRDLRTRKAFPGGFRRWSRGFSTSAPTAPRANA